MSDFDPSKYMIRIPRRKKLPDGRWVDEPGPEYLPVAARIAWFRAEHPLGSINTTAEVDSVHAVTRCEVRDEDGRLLAGDVGLCTAEQWKRYAEKASTTAIGRALAAAGYGTLQAGEDFAEDDHLADTPREPEKPHPARIEQPRPMAQAQAVAAAVDGKAQRDPNGDEARRRFMATAIDRGYHDEERRIDLDRVRDLFGVEREQGAMAAWKRKQQLTWDQMADRLVALDDARREGQQPSLDGMPAVERERPEAAAGAH